MEPKIIDGVTYVPMTEMAEYIARYLVEPVNIGFSFGKWSGEYGTAKLISETTHKSLKDSLVQLMHKDIAEQIGNFILDHDLMNVDLSEMEDKVCLSFFASILLNRPKFEEVKNNEY